MASGNRDIRSIGKLGHLVIGGTGKLPESPEFHPVRRKARQSGTPDFTPSGEKRASRGPRIPKVTIENQPSVIGHQRSAKAARVKPTPIRDDWDTWGGGGHREIGTSGHREIGTSGHREIGKSGNRGTGKLPKVTIEKPAISDQPSAVSQGLI